MKEENKCAFVKKFISSLKRIGINSKNHISLFHLLENEIIVVGYSGGADSLCLVLLLLEVANLLNMEVYPVFVNHGLKKIADIEEAQAADILSSFTGRRMVVQKWNGDKPKSNIYSIARDKRYELLFQAAYEHGAKIIMTAHHADDNIETVLMNIMRGSGAEGICGISQVMELQAFYKNKNRQLLLVRPLLDWSRTEIERYLARRGVNSYVMDEMNKDKRFLRASVRELLNNVKENIKTNHTYDLFYKRFTLLTNNIQRTMTFVEKCTSDWLMKNYCVSHYGAGFFNLRLFAELELEMKLRIMKKMLRNIVRFKYPPRLSSLLLLCDNITTMKPCTLNKCIIAQASQNELIDVVEDMSIKERVMIIVKESQFIDDTVYEASSKLIWDDRFLITCITSEKKNPFTISRFEPKYEKISLPLECNVKSVAEVKKVSKRVLNAVPFLYYGKAIISPLINEVEVSLNGKNYIFSSKYLFRNENNSEHCTWIFSHNLGGLDKNEEHQVDEVTTEMINRKNEIVSD
ncbi:tRNA lysidine(34) synthetase TilS [Candidatus Fokinia crypta]|uniref:tRNA(Ile)-lysidine synthase n=1 Tax=Candidatus Fokinia crypta TaxID=1920990 RepID=A0ABZ0URL7_9RICK|nr:tRNA lysidine(34) synthetase TilS [Candidatus Fokinia cryptica]WPX97649.1 tRNA(Ile)-lysidine synthase [Candidatus Fokinia cryptica]